MKRKAVCLILAALIALSIVPAMVFAAQPIAAAGYADALYELGLFNGTGKNADGTPIYSLEKAPTRAEAITMLVRLLGKESEAKSREWIMPFTDVDEWAKPYVGYAYNNGLTAGVSADKFDSNSKASETQYITFILRALGYSDADGDFSWDKSKVLSNELGITEGAEDTDFLRADVVEISYFALKTQMKNSEDTLIDVLYANHAISTTEVANVNRPKKNADGTKIYLPDGTIDGVSYRDLARACGCDEDLAYIIDPGTEEDHLNNIQYILLTAQWSYTKSNNSSAARTNWGNCERTAFGKMGVRSCFQPALFGVFANYWCEFYYENGGYTLYCSIDPVMSPEDIQTHLIEAYKIIDAKHDEFVKTGKLNANSSDYQKAKVYSDWLTEFERNVTPRAVGFPEASLTETAYGFLGLRHSNCVGNASAVSMAWNYEGISSNGVICGHEPGDWEGHVIPWTVIDGKEYTCEVQGPGLCEMNPNMASVISPYYIAKARKDMGLDYNDVYDPTAPDLLDKAPRCQAYLKDIPTTVQYVETNEAGEEVYLVKIDESYTETGAHTYRMMLTTSGGNGQKSLGGAYNLEKMKAGVNVRVVREQRIDTMFYGMDKIRVYVAE